MKPKPLQPDSKIAIVAPAGRILSHELDFAIHWIKSNGWIPSYTVELFKEYNFGYLYAGPDDHRLTTVQKALNNTDIDAIWFARGGYGSVRLIDQLDFSIFKNNPKWIIGYSDITIFHSYLNNLNIPTLHAVTAKQLNTTYTKESYSTLQNVLLGNKLAYNLPSSKYNIAGTAIGKLVGGNLSILYSQLGSESALQGEDLILFIEDWQENWYHLDRMMMALKRSGLLDRIKGLIVGSFTKMDTRNENPTYNEDYDLTSQHIILTFINELNIPVIFEFPAGHIGDNRTLVLGSDVEINVNKEQYAINWIDGRA